MSIQHSTDDQQFTILRDGYQGELAYSYPSNGVIDFTHTFVEEGLRGQGVADELATAGLAFAREQSLKVRTTCTFMAKFVKRNHAEYGDVLA
jgi:predicted GNAT family acetyltransferase